MSQPYPVPFTEETLEVRMATTMTGGVSLAVWMGGVAREIDLLRQASNLRRSGDTGPSAWRADDEAIERNLYRRFLDLLDLVVEVDVLSGTSAGGINAAFLAYSRARDGNLGPLRDLWIDLGALMDLLREPSDSDVTSLLYGDRRLLKLLHDRLPGLAPTQVSGKGPSTTLYITTTLLTGESSRFTDDLGTLVQDNNQRGLFTFTEDDLCRSDVADALALAARSTASFPGAFEPSFVPCDIEVPEAGEVPVRPAMRPYGNITTGHWAVDGGVLNNQPLDVLLQRVFDRPARRPVRRVLLFVVPSPGPSPELAKLPTTTDLVADPYDLIGGLLKVVGAATNQSISASLRDIVAHNDRVSARTDLRLRLAEMAILMRGNRPLSAVLLGDYLERESERQARRLVRAMLRLIGTWPPQTDKQKIGVPSEWADDLRMGGPAEESCRNAIKDSLTQAWSPGSTGVIALPTSIREFAAFGRSMFDDVKSIALRILRTGYDAAMTEQERRALILCVERVHAVAGQLGRPGPGALARDACEAAVRKSSPDSLTNTATALADRWRADTTAGPGQWAILVGILAGAASTLDAVARSSNGSVELQTYLSYLGLVPRVGAVATIAARMFDLAAAEKALLPVEAGNLQKVELVQLSADTRNWLALSKATAQSKLTGLQVHNFGAFYKKSWRANDWMWGRLDAAGWLIHTLLDPRRLRRIVDREGIKIGHRALWLIAELRKLGPIQLDDRNFESGPLSVELIAELSFLDDTTRPIPQSLPRTSMWLATAWQTLIAADELPRLAGVITGTSAPGTNPTAGAKDETDRSPAATVAWATELPPSLWDPEVVRSQLDACPVPKERLETTEKGTPLMVHTLTKAAATTAAALSSIRQLPGVARPAVTTVHTIALGGYRVANTAKARPRNLIVVGLVLLALGIAAATQAIDILGFSGLILAAIGGYLVTFGVWQRGGRLFGALIAFTVTAAVVSLIAPVVRQSLFGSSETDGGWLGQKVYWLATDWWHPLLAVGILLLIIFLAGLAISTGRPKNRRQLPREPGAFQRKRRRLWRKLKAL